MGIIQERKALAQSQEQKGEEKKPEPIKFNEKDAKTSETEGLLGDGKIVESVDNGRSIVGDDAEKKQPKKKAGRPSKKSKK